MDSVTFKIKCSITSFEQLENEDDLILELEDMLQPPIAEKVCDFYLNDEIPRLLKHYGLPDTVDNRLRCWNWGVGNLYRKGMNNAPKETKDYIKKYHELEVKKWSR